MSQTVLFGFVSRSDLFPSGLRRRLGEEQRCTTETGISEGFLALIPPLWNPINQHNCLSVSLSGPIWPFQCESASA